MNKPTRTIEVSMVKWFKDEIRWQKRAIKLLAKYREMVNDAIDMEKHGHTPNWNKIQKLDDMITDKYDFSDIVY